jgi:hypothetical protein
MFFMMSAELSGGEPTGVALAQVVISHIVQAAKLCDMPPAPLDEPAAPLAFPAPVLPALPVPTAAPAVPSDPAFALVPAVPVACAPPAPVLAPPAPPWLPEAPP